MNIESPGSSEPGDFLRPEDKLLGLSGNLKISTVIPSEAWESPGEMLRFGTAFQEIAASGFALLAMTAVINGWLIYNEMHP